MYGYKDSATSDTSGLYVTNGDGDKHSWGGRMNLTNRSEGKRPRYS